MKNNNNKVKEITGIAILLAVMAALQLLANYITIGPVSITLALVPIVVCSILYGPWAGAFLGLINGAITIAAPSTLALFMPSYPVPTVVVCLLKMACAGLVPGLIYKAMQKKHGKVGVVLASLSAPVVNTGLFSIGALLWFKPLLESYVSASYANIYAVLFLAFIGWNFFLEFGINAILASTIVYIVNVYKYKNQAKKAKTVSE